uniref:G-protein coupled receptors family 1 profile domain-containing protein n=1 Tax=Acrobeloides nanus TaxID=290746 RepID=A0A914E829_9BILA
MSICDSICLLALLCQTIFHTSIKIQSNVIHQNFYIHAIFCKLDMYLIHSMSAFSVWCWLTLSVLRYVAVFHPLKYHTIWRQPRYALGVLASTSLLLELWIPLIVSYDVKNRSCSESPDVISNSVVRTSHLLDILLSYMFPAFIRILLDGIVLSRCYQPNANEFPPVVLNRRHGISAPSGQAANDLVGEKAYLLVTINRSRGSISYKREQFVKKKNAMIMRSLTISAINLCCNLPSHVLRALWTLEEEPQIIPAQWMFVLEAISQLLYFGQFTCNAFYLSTTIYETSNPVKTYSTTIAPSRNNFSKIFDDDI